MNRWKASNPCPICSGHQSMPQGQGVRCSGYRSSDGLFAYCSREEQSGALDPWKSGFLFAHKLGDKCRCGMQHGTDGEPFNASRPRNLHGDHSPIPWSIPDSDIEMVHPYERNGEPQWELCRIWKHARDRHHGAKALPRHRDPEGQWYFGIGEKWKGRKDKPLYNESAAIQELRLGGHVFIVEGERDADALRSADCIATCNPDGAGCFREFHAQLLITAMTSGDDHSDPDLAAMSHSTITIVSDDDPSGVGLEHAKRIYWSLLKEKSLQGRVRVALPPEGSKDVAEAMNAENRSRAANG